jgi:hypothetical protein
MTASDHCSSREKTLANRGPSTHEAALLNSVPQQLTCRIVNEVHLGAGWASHGCVAAFCILWRVRHPMLHMHPSLGTSEYDRLNRGVQYASYRRSPKFRMFT